MKSQFVSKFAKQRKRNQSEADIKDPVIETDLAASPIIICARNPNREVV